MAPEIVEGGRGYRTLPGYDKRNMPDDPGERYKAIRKLFRENYYPVLRGELFDTILSLVDAAFCAGKIDSKDYHENAKSIIVESIIEATGCEDKKHEKLKFKIRARIGAPVKEDLIETIKEAINEGC